MKLVYNLAKWGAGEQQKKLQTYLGVEIVDHVNGGVDIAGVNGPANLDARLDELFILLGESDVCFSCEFCSCPRISFADQVVHDHEIDVPVASVRTCFSQNMNIETEVI